jgi:hypothetical protein
MKERVLFYTIYDHSVPFLKLYCLYDSNKYLYMLGWCVYLRILRRNINNNTVHFKTFIKNSDQNNKYYLSYQNCYLNTLSNSNKTKSD